MEEARDPPVEVRPLRLGDALRHVPLEGDVGESIPSPPFLDEKTLTEESAHDEEKRRLVDVVQLEQCVEQEPRADECRLLEDLLLDFSLGPVFFVHALALLELELQLAWPVDQPAGRSVHRQHAPLEKAAQDLEELRKVAAAQPVEVTRQRHARERVAENELQVPLDLVFGQRPQVELFRERRHPIEQSLEASIVADLTGHERPTTRRCADPNADPRDARKSQTTGMALPRLSRRRILGRHPRGAGDWPLPRPAGAGTTQRASSRGAARRGAERPRFRAQSSSNIRGLSAGASPLALSARVAGQPGEFAQEAVLSIADFPLDEEAGRTRPP
jgi:hypothetical protein